MLLCGFRLKMLKLLLVMGRCNREDLAESFTRLFGKVFPAQFAGLELVSAEDLCVHIEFVDFLEHDLDWINA